MPRRPRIEIAGYYNIINRGVEQRVIFKEASDYEYFEELMCFYMKSYGITLHNYCLMVTSKNPPKTQNPSNNPKIFKWHFFLSNKTSA